MKNPFAKKEWSVGTVLNILWIVISVPFVLYVLYQFVITASYQAGFQTGTENGAVTAYTEVLKAANNQNCSAFPVNMGQVSVELINTKCVSSAASNTSEKTVEPKTTTQN